MKSLITNMRNNKDKRKLKTEPKFQVDLNEEQKRAKTLFYEYDVNFIHGDYGCLSKGTKVLMYDGSLKKVEDVVVGDKLMGPDSTSRTVLELKRGRDQMYWVHQNRGMSYRVNENHILSLRRVIPAKFSRKTMSNGERVPQKNLPPISEKKDLLYNISVKNYLSLGTGKKIQTQGYIPESIEFKSKALPLDPYYLGLWLGDGSSNCNNITTGDVEIVEWLEEFASSNEVQLKEKKYKDRTPTYSIVDEKATWKRQNRITKELRDLDLIENKHIPDIYKRSSKSQRMKLLAGLIDSDGYYHKEGKGYEITQKSKRLIKDIDFIVRSLGFRTYVDSKTATLKREGKEDYECIVYRLTFSPDKAIPVLLDRKRYENDRIQVKNQRYTNISIEKDIVDNYYGFTLDGDNLFLLEDFTVTHNSGKTLLACEIALSSFRKKQFNKIVITRPVVRNELGFLPGDVEAKMEPLVAPIVHNFNMLQNPSMTEKMMADKSIEILPVSYSKGITFVESVIIVDEYEDLTYSDFRMLLTRLGKDSKIIFCGSKEQVDRKIGEYSCMHETLKLKDSGIVGFSTLKSNHRNQAIYEVLDFLEGTDTEKEEEYEECKNSES